MALLMVGCDVSATSRPWVMHKTTVDWLMEEFYKQVKLSFILKEMGDNIFVLFPIIG